MTATKTVPSETAYWREDQRLRDLVDAMPSTTDCATCPVRIRAFYDMAAAVERQAVHIPAIHGLWGRRAAHRYSRHEAALYSALALLEDSQPQGARDALLAENPRNAAAVEDAVMDMSDGITRAGLAALHAALPDWEVDGLVNPYSIARAYA